MQHHEHSSNFLLDAQGHIQLNGMSYVVYSSHPPSIPVTFKAWKIDIYIKYGLLYVPEKWECFGKSKSTTPVLIINYNVTADLLMYSTYPLPHCIFCIFYFISSFTFKLICFCNISCYVSSFNPQSYSCQLFYPQYWKWHWYWHHYVVSILWWILIHYMKSSFYHKYENATE